MKKSHRLQAIVSILLMASPFVSPAATFFSDTFGSGSTLDQAPVAPTPTSTSYQTAIGGIGTSSIAPARLSITFPNTSSVLGETLALFTNAPVVLSQPGDYVAVTVVFTNVDNILTNVNANASLNIGLFNSGGVSPNQGPIVLNAGNTTGGTEDWIGYASRIFLSGNANIFTRPAQTPSGTSSQNQDLLFTGASSSQAFNNPAGTGLGNTAGNVPLTEGSVYTLHFAVTVTGINSQIVSNSIYAGVGTGGTPIFSQAKVTGANFVTSAFDGFAVGWRNASAAAQVSTMDIASIEVTGQYSPPTPPVITSQPSPAIVATNGSCAFFLTAAGANLTYQWHRSGTNILDGGNIAGATSDMLVLSPAGTADALSGANGYYCTVTSTGGSTNSTTNSLTLTIARNLVWAGSGSDWDVGVSANWLSNATPTVFHFGDTVTFNDSGAGALNVMLSGRYVSAASVRVDTSTAGFDYVFGGTGSLAGPSQLLYKGSGLLTLTNVNTHTGGTVVSNASAYLVVNNYDGLGDGPVVLAKAGGQMEIVPAGSATYGIKGDVIIADDFAITYDANSPGFGTVLLGNLAGTSGKALTFNRNSTNTAPSRVRVYGTNTVCDANLILNDTRVAFAPYHSSGLQTYNGVISGGGLLVQRGGATTILNGQNTYSGGTTPTTGTIGFGTNTTGTVISGPIGTGPLLLNPELPNVAGSGTVFASGGARTIANPIQYLSATNNLTLIVGGTNNLTFTGPFTLNGNDGFGPVTNRTLQVNNAGLTTLLGVVSDGGLGFGLIKTGNGILALNNTETYKGPTVISGGVLQVNGQIGTNDVTVATNGALGGTGTILGAVTVQQGGTLAPGTSIGTLTLKSNLTILGNLSIEVNSSAGTTSDKTLVTGFLTNAGAGTVIVTNLGPALVGGNTFTLFDKAMANGAAMTITGGSAIWTNKLAIDGTIAVVTVLSTTPTNITTKVNGSNLELSWPLDHIGWLLQAQTNAVNTGLKTNWVDVPGSTLVTSVTNTIDRTQGSVFYRMIHP